MGYRFDVRSKDQFKKDIKNSHILEAEIAARLCIVVHAETKEWPTLLPTGSDMSGEFIEKDSQVSHDADFSINSIPVEITRSDVICKRTFHQKSSKVQRAIDGKYDLIFINGYKEEKQPKFVWLTSEEVKYFTQKAISKYGNVLHPGAGKTGFIGKAAFRYDVYWFEDLWRPLPVLIDNIPEEYKKIIKATKV